MHGSPFVAWIGQSAGNGKVKPAVSVTGAGMDFERRFH
jgi:hypothetical protein